MCSVTWLLSDDGYQVFFNRDEQKTRALALPPQQEIINGTNVLMPIDPVGGGSWISINDRGLALCLLNNYQGHTPNRALLSRGLLLKLLSSCHTKEQTDEHFKVLDLHQFAPFTLLVFSPQLCLSHPQVTAYAWDGIKVNIHDTDSPLFSSGVELADVQHYRKAVYASLTSANKNQQSLLRFHAHHHPEHGHLSTCMHREDAHTVSFTHLEVSGHGLSMSYVPGSPCTRLTTQALQQHRYTFTEKEILIA
ncbi:NRDE family protein [Vibrio profundi]|uniref:NRDE family protein n=1 Tax=Vibrio profundi TaxID=1774960 RepID=UPI003736BB5F